MNQTKPQAGGAHDAPQQVSNWNLPNILTSLRIIFIPLFAWLVLRGDNQHLPWMWAAFGVFVALMITDKLDGDIARARGLVTNFGKIADPIADKALTITAMVCLNAIGAMSVWITVLIVIRELGITLWRMVALRRGVVVPASRGGKIKTALQALGLGMYLCPLPSWMDIPTDIVMWIAVVVTVVTGIQYLVDARKVNN
ncbi:phosphatidylglycerophosphate synthase [Corynebacterium renale]|uniref:CDP-diacylglycerol--glycerol-3-phosphate 3-phosphatidyltransferase n=1 Tax=Corynebacterium renale TaxID=1724 RepID=UPI000DA36017|nr:CDP-diacylglycerol--glycerol-3-phosphate 3-phosphatidyltransferase [Corynebacterium renale]SQG64867.1 phosphatidylglycerophosphate synthase [Corynebacterium renale]STC96475.1 phosphatidylglycerophosphate synthase [Corynebacterium renale]